MKQADTNVTTAVLAGGSSQFLSKGVLMRNAFFSARKIHREPLQSLSRTWKGSFKFQTPRQWTMSGYKVTQVAGIVCIGPLLQVWAGRFLGIWGGRRFASQFNRQILVYESSQQHQHESIASCSCRCRNVCKL